MKTRKCWICRKRQVLQQDWKTAIEKAECLTCSTFMNLVKMMERSLSDEAKIRGIGKGVGINVLH